MSAYLMLPYYFLRFWYLETPSRFLDFYLSLNHAFFQLFSIPLFLRTFFQPLKNEYRKGLVGFSLAMGIGMKSFFLSLGFFFFLLLLLAELVILVAFLAFPIITFLLLLW